jgi:hypothetical protein
MRVSDGARKINSQGGAIFVHDDWRACLRPPRFPVQREK